jgi:hypothetical protein
MPNNLRNDGDKTMHRGLLDEWRRGIQRMRSLGSEFVAIYGAEPMLRPVMLPEVVTAIYETGMSATVITALPKGERMRQLLRNSPLDSITMSYDVATSDADRVTKTDETLPALEMHRHLRDRAVVMTITAENVHTVLDVCDQMHAQGVWFLFDIFHSSGGPHSKCGHDAALAPPPAEAMRAVAARLLERKKYQGLKIHASEAYLELVATKYDGDPRSLWHCAGKPTGWITVDSDGSILACDDYQRRYPGGKIWDDFDEQNLAAWMQLTRAECVGCAWNTHVDACAIEGGMSRGTYVHQAVSNAAL